MRAYHFIVFIHTKRLNMAQDQQCLYNCADITGACIPPEAQQIIHGMRTTENVKCWNSQAVRKFKESTANTIRIIIKTARESVNPCSIESNFYKKMENYTTRRHALLLAITASRR